MKYTVEFSNPESGWEGCEQFATYEQAIAKLYEWVADDKQLGYQDGEVALYRIADLEGNTVALYKCEHDYFPDTYEYYEGEDVYDVPFGNKTLRKAKLRTRHGGKREGAGRKPNATPTKPLGIRVTEEEAIKIKEFLAELRKEK